MNKKFLKSNSDLYSYLYSILLAASASDPCIVISVSDFIRNSSLTDEDKNRILDFYALILSELDFNT